MTCLASCSSQVLSLSRVSISYSTPRAVSAATADLRRHEAVASFSSSAPVDNKLKTHKGTAKRWKSISNGNFKRAQAGKQHLNSSFSSSRINALSQTVYSNATQTKTLRRLLPYSRFRRSYSTNSLSSAFPDLDAPSYALVDGREVLKISGPDAAKFLKGLTSKDVDLLGGGYSGVLNASGRVLQDIFIYPLPASTYLIDYPSADSSSSAPTLEAYLKKFILRSKVRISSVSKEYSIYSVWGDEGAPEERSWKMGNGGSGEPHWEVNGAKNSIAQEDEIGCWDLRGGGGRGGMGRRILVPAERSPSFASTHEKQDPEIYHLKRMLLGVPEGPSEILPGQSLPMESCMDVMGGIDFRKGCYVGQELTVRTYHTGFTRKRIMPLRFLPAESSSSPSSLLPPNAPAAWTSDQRPQPGDQVSYVPPASAASQKPKAAVKVLSVHPQWSVGLGLMRLELVDRVWGLSKFGAAEMVEGEKGKLVTGGEVEWEVWAGRGRGWYDPGAGIDEDVE